MHFPVLDYKVCDNDFFNECKEMLEYKHAHMSYICMCTAKLEPSGAFGR